MNLLETHTGVIIFLNSVTDFLFFSASAADKTLEDKDSVDGGLSSSSSSSKAPPGGRKAVAGSVRRPSSATTAKSTGEETCKLGPTPALRRPKSAWFSL